MSNEIYLFGNYGITLQTLKNDIQRFIDFASTIETYLDIRFVLEQAPKYGIRSLDFVDPRVKWMDPSWWETEGWRDGAYAKIQRADTPSKPIYDMSFNPHLDRENAAETLSRMVEFSIEPQEVYYFTWFHECGHTRQVAGDLAQDLLATRAFFLGQEFRKGEGILTEHRLKEIRFLAEERATEWAIGQFRAWRNNRTRAGNLDSILIPLLMPYQAETENSQN